MVFTATDRAGGVTLKLCCEPRGLASMPGKLKRFVSIEGGLKGLCSALLCIIEFFELCLALSGIFAFYREDIACLFDQGESGCRLLFFYKGDLELAERRRLCLDSLKLSAGPLEEIRSFGFFECCVIGSRLSFVGE